MNLEDENAMIAVNHTVCRTDKTVRQADLLSSAVMHTLEHGAYHSSICLIGSGRQWLVNRRLNKKF
jgi:hypothetical protein